MSNMFGSRLDSQEVSSYFWILAALIMRLKILDQREGLLSQTGPKKLDVVQQKKVVLPFLLKPRKSGKLDSCWNENDHE